MRNTQNRLPKGYWKNTDNGIGAMASMIDFLGRYPLRDEAKKYLGGLPSAIDTNSSCGGWFKFKETMGYEDGKLEKGYWENIDNGIGAMEGLIDFLGRYPTYKEFGKYLGGLHSVFRKKDNPYGNWNKFKETMGYGLDDKLPSGYWKSTDSKIGAIAGVVKLIGRYPKTAELEKMKLGGLVHAIYEKGGWSEFKIKYNNVLEELTGITLGEDSNNNRRWHWHNEDEKMGMMTGIIDFFGRYPTSRDLKKMKLGGLVHAIERDYGWNKFKEMMGYGISPEILPARYWNDTYNGMGAMAGLIEFLGGKYPGTKEVKEHIPGLYKTIYKKNSPYGNWNKFKETMGYFEEDSTDKLIADMKTEEMRTLVSKLGLDRRAMWDILAVKYKVDKSKIIELFNSEPSLSSYMGDFVTGINDLPDWEYVADKTLPYDDDNGTIRKILEKSLFDSVMVKLGPKPNTDDVERELETLKYSDGMKEIEKIRVKRGD